MRATPYTVWWALHGAAVVSMPARTTAPTAPGYMPH